MKGNTGEVVVILPYVRNKILLQLRDEIPGIAFPGQWGFFGGSIISGESTEVAGRRELLEEIGFSPEEMCFLETHVITDCGNLISHAYYCPLTVSLDRLALTEGSDMGLFTVDEILQERLYSERHKAFFPVATTYYIGFTALRAMKELDKLR